MNKLKLLLILIVLISCNNQKRKKLDKGTLINGNRTMKVYDIHSKLEEVLKFINREYIEYY